MNLKYDAINGFISGCFTPLFMRLLGLHGVRWAIAISITLVIIGPFLGASGSK
jgi:hypothetical protein